MAIQPPETSPLYTYFDDAHITFLPVRERINAFALNRDDYGGRDSHGTLAWCMMREVDEFIGSYVELMTLLSSQTSFETFIKGYEKMALEFGDVIHLLMDYLMHVQVDGAALWKDGLSHEQWALTGLDAESTEKNTTFAQLINATDTTTSFKTLRRRSDIDYHTVYQAGLRQMPKAKETGYLKRGDTSIEMRELKKLSIPGNPEGLEKHKQLLLELRRKVALLAVVEWDMDAKERSKQLHLKDTASEFTVATRLSILTEVLKNLGMVSKALNIEWSLPTLAVNERNNQRHPYDELHYGYMRLGLWSGLGVLEGGIESIKPDQAQRLLQKSYRRKQLPDTVNYIPGLITRGKRIAERYQRQGKEIQLPAMGEAEMWIMQKLRKGEKLAYTPADEAKLIERLKEMMEYGAASRPKVIELGGTTGLEMPPVTDAGEKIIKLRQQVVFQRGNSGSPVAQLAAGG
ncbi:MAG TPA: hypothetical protein VD999_01240 [Vitreimonas sp.]|nr:hypothetical protein [Vitreimonas sp.]